MRMKKTIAALSPVVLACALACSDRYQADRGDDQVEPAPDTTQYGANRSDDRTAPETNTERNERDRGDATLTPEDQGSSEADMNITQNVRQSIVADDTLSTTAHNVKVITVDGVVTLRGPVPSEREKSSVYAKAQQVPGVRRVVDELEVITQ